MAETPVVIQKWIRIAFINLLIVALIGTIMRYKIAYYLPFIEQKNFLHAHSYFAFTGWITHALMVLMVAFLIHYLPAVSLKKYKWLLAANLVTAYGMLLSFILGGYGIFSITLSTLSIFNSYLFGIIFWKDVNKIQTKTISIFWFKAAIVFNVLSTLGAFFLSYMIINKIQDPRMVIAGNYYYLHFQYNGWFLFACMGLLSEKLTKCGIAYPLQKNVFWLFALACVPAYFLSALWLPIPLWVYFTVVIAAIVQLAGWTILFKTVFNNRSKIFAETSSQTRGIFILCALAFSIKLLLQAGSTIPFLSKLAFGFRPVIIGYLHLMLLGVITLFIIGYSKMNRFIITRTTGNAGILIFICGIIVNEIFLMIQGISYMNYINIPWINELLLGAATCMFCGVSLLNLGLRRKNHTYV